MLSSRGQSESLRERFFILTLLRTKVALTLAAGQYRSLVSNLALSTSGHFFPFFLKRNLDAFPARAQSSPSTAMLYWSFKSLRFHGSTVKRRFLVRYEMVKPNGQNDGGPAAQAASLRCGGRMLRRTRQEK